MSDIRLITFDPGHFHAALMQKEMYPGVSPVVHVYAPLGADLADHLARIARFNARLGTSWQLEIHSGPDPLDRLLQEKPGNVVIFSGRNRTKIDAILASVEAGLHVLADKPWIVRGENFPKLERALASAARNRVIAYDIMTERFEITSLVQGELISDPEVFGDIIAGSADEPGVYMESVHHLLKTVAGVPNLRPAWYFDIREQGEALADVGTHLVDLAQWTLFPGQALDYRRDVALDSASRWPTTLTEAEFLAVTGEKAFPDYLGEWVRGGALDYFGNTSVVYRLRGVHVKLDVLWRYQAPAGGGDTHLAVYRGTRSRVEVRQTAAENYRPEVYITPEAGCGKAVAVAVAARLEKLAAKWPGLALEEHSGSLRVAIPDRFRIGHEAHFAQVTQQFLNYMAAPETLPGWENPNMLAKYWTTTRGVGVSRGEA